MNALTSNVFPSVKILALEDCVINRVRFRKFVRATQIHASIQEVGNLFEFEETLKHCSYDVVFVDFNLPDGNGHEALGILKSSSRNSRVSSAMITDNACPSVAGKAQELGSIACLQKSDLTSEVLMKIIIEAIEIDKGFARSPVPANTPTSRLSLAVNRT